jgi:glycosyltransferase involved in cell wall biosynthesis
MNGQIQHTELTDEMPLVTFALVAYNQEDFICEAVAGAFAQTYSPLEIILSDDCSSDNTYKIIEEMAAAYNGPHKIVLNRNEINIGVGCHINNVVELAKGEWIVGAAGDDISLPYRVTEIMHAARKKQNIYPLSIWSRAQYMKSGGDLMDAYVSSDGIPPTLNEMIFNKKVVMGCTHAFHKDIFRIFGPLHNKVIFEDNALSFRSYLAGDIVYVDKSLVYYRQHDSNITNYVSNFDKIESARRIQKRREYAVVGIYQRLLDLLTYKELNSGFEKDEKKIRKLLMRALRRQELKKNLAYRFPAIDDINVLLLSFFKQVAARFGLLKKSMN